MALKFCSFASGSSGNCYLIKKGKAALLIDAGISGIFNLTSLGFGATAIPGLSIIDPTNNG